jgi:thiol-disulfide isomerase/thioredoxin
MARLDSLRIPHAVLGSFALISLLMDPICVNASPSDVKYVPAETHTTVAMPGSQWLNVSRALKPEDLKDKIVLLDFWTYCCINCIQNLPELAKIEKEFKDDLLVIGVHSAKFDTEKETDQIRQAVLRNGVTHPIVNDHDFRIWRKFEVRAWPTLVLLRPDGTIDRTVSGEGKIPELRKAVLELRKKFPKRSKAKVPVALEKDRAVSGEFNYPSKVVYDSASKKLVVVDSSHHQIAVYDWDAKSPTLLKPAFRLGKSGVAGYANGSGGEVRFNRPQGAVLSKGVLYVADTGNHAIRRVELASKRVSTLAGNGKQGKLLELKKKVAASTALVSPWDVAFHPNENHLVMAMAGTHQLWSLDMKTRMISVIAGTGKESIDDGMPGENSLAQPSGLASLLGSLYFVDAETSALRFYFEGFVRTLVGKDLFDFGFKDGDRKRALLQHPTGVLADVTGIFVADTYNHSIRRYDAEGQKIETVIGDGKSGKSGDDEVVDARKARLNEPSSIAKLSDSLFLISDTNNHRLVLWNREESKVQRMRIQGEKLSSVELKPSEGKSTRKSFDEKLPNRIAIPEGKVNSLSPEVRIILPERYQLNEAAPTYAALFEGEAGNAVWRAQWSKKDLESLSVKLPRLKKGTSYHFQGTIYYCLDAKSSICEIASFSVPVRVDSSGKERIDISIPLRPTIEKD